MPTYSEIMTVDLTTLTTAADRWDGMAGELHKQETAYRRDVHGISMGQSWVGLSATAADQRFDVTLKEFQKAQVEAKALAALLRDAHTQFTDLRTKLASARADAVDAGMAVSEQGVVSFDTTKLSDGERNVLHHDPDGQQSVRKAVMAWQAHINHVVKSVGDADVGAQIALQAAVQDPDAGDGTLVGFNGAAHSDIKTYRAEAAAAAKDSKTETDGWTSEGEASASGPGLGAEAKSPDLLAGELGEAEASADLGSAEASGKLTNGSVALTAGAEAYAGAKASSKGSMSSSIGEASVFAGGKASGDAKADAGGYFGINTEAETMAGAEASANAGASGELIGAGAEAFAGAKAGVTAGADAAGVGVGYTVEGWAGVGAEGSWGLRKETDGTWKLKSKVGVAPGLGGADGFEVSFNPGDFIDSVGSVFSKAF